MEKDTSNQEQNAQSTFEFLQQEVEAWSELFGKTREHTQKHLEEQQEQLGGYVKAFTQKLEENGVVSTEQLERLQQQWEHLQVQMALGKAEGKEAYEERRKRVEDNMKQFRDEFARVEREMEANTEKYNEDFQKEFQRLQSKFEAFQVQAELGRKELSAEAEKRRQEATEKLHEFREELEQKRSENEAKTQAFSKELFTSWEHIKKAFRELFV